MITGSLGAIVNPYKVLQVDKDAEQEVIDAAYRRLAAKYHPDRDGATSATQRMKEINAAYEMLKDPERRRAHRVYQEKRESGYEAVKETPKATSVAQARQAAPAEASIFRRLGRTVRRYTSIDFRGFLWVLATLLGWVLSWQLAIIIFGLWLVMELGRSILARKFTHAAIVALKLVICLAIGVGILCILWVVNKLR